MNYRRLTEDEILRLKSQSCLADDWGKVTVAEEFSTEFVLIPVFRVRCVWECSIQNLCCREESGSIPVCGM